MRRQQLVNNAATTLTSGINDSVTSVTVDDGSVFPSSGDYQLLVGSEIMLVTARTSNVLTVARGAEGTTAASHSGGAAVTAILTAGALDQLLIDLTGAGKHRYPFRLLSAAGDTLTQADFTLLNVGTSVITDDASGGITAQAVETTGPYKVFHRAAPSTPYTVTANILFGPGMTYSTSGSLAGIGFRESGTGKFVAGIAETGDNVNFMRFTDPNTFSANATTNRSYNFFNDQLWYQIEDPGSGNLVFRVSSDGQNWFELGLDGRTAFMAGGPDQVCFAFNPRGGANKLFHLRSWVEE